MVSDYLDTRQLEAFVAVVSIGSITGAAKALGKSQPVVTRLIQDLEGELGFALLHRNGPRITPTEKGVAFYSQAELFLSGLKTISERARRIEASRPTSIEVASIPAIAASLLPRALATLSPERFPNHVHLQSISSENVVQAVVAGTADLGVVSLPLDNPGIEVHWLGEVPCVAVVAEDHPLADKNVLSATDLSGHRLIASANPFRLRMRINEALGKHGVEPASVIDSNATYVSLSLARMGLGIAIVESVTLWGLPVQGVKVLPLSFRIPFQWGLVTAAGRPAISEVEQLVAAARRIVADIPHAVIYDTLAEVPAIDRGN
ncbi:LysR family transcriptional regulator [Rhizobium sp. RM]|uniref:LysR family transcriptional regulator n=1 Tax=Rhizobium sp. RM TaxID=2748079 RepID=UPI00110D9211|nr:LysR family transcriptional regulator [Rhizobium sp. RM]NWJ25806.1 LysR family transcriptional regulator [Rhizobium sp. RM]TMV21638.1 LysR family transcriptional regulator [Rhizobium sp. Td3]